MHQGHEEHNQMGGAPIAEPPDPANPLQIVQIYDLLVKRYEGCRVIIFSTTRSPKGLIVGFQIFRVAPDGKSIQPQQRVAFCSGGAVIWDMIA